MLKMKMFAGLLVFALMASALWSAPVISVETGSRKSFNINDTFEVNINLAGNEGAYSVNLDISYNNQIFELLDVQNGNLLPDIENKSEMLVARAAYNEGGRIIISNSLIGDQSLFTGNGTLATLRFKALRSATDQSIRLNPQTTAIYLKAEPKATVMPKRADLVLQNLENLTVVGPYTHYFIQIISPYNNYKSTTAKLDYLVQTTILDPSTKDKFAVGIKKVTQYQETAPLCAGTKELKTPVANGTVLFAGSDPALFSLQSGYNYIVATLYVNGIACATAIKQVYYEVRDQGVRITNPINNWITGKSTITVEGESSFAKITLNNRLMTSSIQDNGLYTFICDNQQLKEGFNKLVVMTENPDAKDIIYKDSIEVYYQRDESIFKFLSPEEGKVFKGGIINIKGMIDTADKDLVQVKMRARFQPKGNEDTIDFVFRDTDKPDSEIILRDLANSENLLLSNFIFETSFNTALLNSRSSGTLTFYATKVDKQGKIADIEIQRKVIIDTNPLQINLMQPNIINREVLVNKELFEPTGPIEESQKLKLQVLSRENIDISDTCQISLQKKANPVINNDLAGKDIVKIVETVNGDQYAIANSFPNKVDIYKKQAGGDFFTSGTPLTYYNAFAHSAVEFGNNSLLIGISNDNTDNSSPCGLLLYNNSRIRQAKLPFAVKEVQYITRVDNDYFLYSSSSLYLYRFNDADVIIDPNDHNNFEIRNLQRYSLPNNLIVKNFIVTDKGNTVVLATDNGLYIYKYNAYANVYSQLKLFKDKTEIRQLETTQLNSDYRVYFYAWQDTASGRIALSALIQKGENNFTDVDFSTRYKELYEIEYVKNNSFLLYGKEANDTITLKQVQVFYDLVPDSTGNLLLSTLIPDQSQKKLFYKDNQNYLLYGKGITMVSNEYVDGAGNLEFSLSDANVDGFMGFSFDAPPEYRGQFDLFYSASNSAEATNYTPVNVTGTPLADVPLSRYEVSFNASYDFLKLKIVLRKTSSGYHAPAISNITLIKKEYVKTISSILNLSGFINDKTIMDGELTINGRPVPIEANGAFYDQVQLDTSADNAETYVKLYATNRDGEVASLDFTVYYVHNQPTITNVSVEPGVEAGQQLTVPSPFLFPRGAAVTGGVVGTNQETINLLGSFSGLDGAQVNVEMYTLDAHNEISRFIRSYNAKLNITERTNGLVAGSFVFNKILLVPGTQRIILICMNPFGAKQEWQLDVNYEVSDEKIVVTNYQLVGDALPAPFMVKKQANRYFASFELKGNVITSKDVDFVNLRSDNTYITFSKDNQKEVSFIQVPLSEIDKKFSVYVNILMHDDQERITPFFRIWPGSIRLADLSRDISLEALKVFSQIKPDFSPTVFNQATGEIQVKFKFNEAVPASKIMRMRFNHTDVMGDPIYLPLANKNSNFWFTYENGIYTLNQMLNANDGSNVLDWWFYRDNDANNQVTAGDTLLSASGNTDFLLFQYNAAEKYHELSVDFPDNKILYDTASLQAKPLIISFDPRSTPDIRFNGKVLDPGTQSKNNEYRIDLTAYPNLLNQGMNNIEVEYELASMNVYQIKTCTFKYDSIIPQVKIVAIDSCNDFQKPYIRTITAEITEANLADAYIVYNNGLCSQKATINILADGKYIYKWDNLESMELLPSAFRTLYVEAVDLSGNKGVSTTIAENWLLEYDITLSNNYSATQVAVTGSQFVETPDITKTIGGTKEEGINLGGYRNEDGFFDQHLKYERQEPGLTGLRDDITNNFDKDLIFNTNRKYLMFEFDNAADTTEGQDLAYRSQTTLTKKAAVTPVLMLEQIKATNENLINSFALDPNNPSAGYSLVQGYRSPDAHNVGVAKAIGRYKDYILLLDYLNQDDDPDYEYRSIVIYNTNDTMTIPKRHNIPQIVYVIDDAKVQNASDFVVQDNFLFVICGTQGIQIYDLTSLEPVNKTATYICTVGNGDCQSVIRKGDDLYVATRDKGIQIYSLIDITFPVLKYQETKPMFLPTNLVSTGSEIYALAKTAATGTSVIVRYPYYSSTVSTETLSNSSLATIPGNIGDVSRLWNDGNLFYVSIDTKSDVLVYDSGTVQWKPSSPGKFLNALVDSSLGKFYPSTNGIQVFNQSTGQYSLMDGGICYNLVVYNGIIYSAAGDDGLKIIKSVTSGETSGFPGTWTICSSSGAVRDSTSVKFSYNINNNTYTGKVNKTLTNPLIIDPTQSVSVEFKLNNPADTKTALAVTLNCTGISLTKYFITADNPDAFWGSNIEKVSNNTSCTGMLKTGDFGISTALQLNSIDVESVFVECKDSVPTKAVDDVCTITSVSIPVYSSYCLPLTHAAFKVDDQPGVLTQVQKEMKIFTQQNTVITTDQKAIVYLSPNEALQNAFEEFSGQFKSNDKGGIEYPKSYFDQRLSRYVIGQVHLQGSTRTELAPLDDFNKKAYNDAYTNFFNRRLEEQGGATPIMISMGEIDENFCLNRPLASGTYHIYLTDTLTVAPYTSGNRVMEKTRKEINIPRTANGTISFWVRTEEEIPGFINYTTGNRWQDYNSTVGKAMVSWGSNLDNEANYRFIAKSSSIAFVQYKNTATTLKTDADYDPANCLEAPVNTISGNQWHLAALSWDETGALIFYLDGKQINEIPKHFNNFDFDRFLAERIVFGDIGQDIGSFYYSLAEPMIFNKKLSALEVDALYKARNRLQKDGYLINLKFNGAVQLDKSADCKDKVETINPAYEETINRNGVVVTKGIKNYIVPDVPTNKLMLSGQPSGTELNNDNLNITYTTNDNGEAVIRLTLKDPTLTGYYHLTDGEGKGLSIPGAESYTFFGWLLTSTTKENLCVIKVNDSEKKFLLTPGEFQFTYSDVHDPLRSMDIYFQVNESLEFKANNFGFNTGRYKGNEGTDYPEDSVRMFHTLGYKESIILYYMPLFHSAWELNNEEIVILDSQLYKIGIHNNSYYATLKTLDKEITIQSDTPTPVSGGLHQLSLVYDFSTLTFKFYIDAKLEAVSEKCSFSIPTFVGQEPAVHNLTLGGSMDKQNKAQGIIEDLRIYPEIVSENFLQDDFQQRARIISIIGNPIFDKPDVELTLQNNLSDKVLVDYIAREKNQSLSPLANWTRTELQGNGSILFHQKLSVGQYLLDLRITNPVTGKLIKIEEFPFVVSYAPSLQLTKYKPLLIRGDKSLHFELERDMKSSFAEDKGFIELKFYASSQPIKDTDLPLLYVIEDRFSSTHGQYFVVKALANGLPDKLLNTQLTRYLAFNYDITSLMSSPTIYYRIAAYYCGKDSQPSVIDGTSRILSLETPEIEQDAVTQRPWRVSTGIQDYRSLVSSLNMKITYLKCAYSILKLNSNTQEYSNLEDGMLSFDESGRIAVNLYSYTQPGNYQIRFQPVDEDGNKGDIVQKDVAITETAATTATPDVTSALHIDDLDFIGLDKETGTATYSFTGGVANLPAGASYVVKVQLEDSLTHQVVDVLAQKTITTLQFKELLQLAHLAEGATYTMTAQLAYKGETVEKVEKFCYKGKNIAVEITHGPKGFISYNNLFFNWTGTVDGKEDGALSYRYSLDNAPWGITYLNHIEFYNLADGAHSFKVQAFTISENSTVTATGNPTVYSAVKSNSFVIDTQKPVIKEQLIHLDVVKDSAGIAKCLKLTGEKDAITDTTLLAATANNQVITLNSNGFTLDNIPLEADGDNSVEVAAVDMLGNTTTITKVYHFDVLAITYPPVIKDLANPVETDFVKYSPLTVYGHITDSIEVTKDTKIYVDDPFGRRTATINFDRTFFIENVKINPGSRFKGIKTVLKFTTDFGNGKVLAREFPVYAKEVIKPIDLNLSVHAVSGGADTTTVKMTAVSDVANITCWSFDYDGNGVYEDEYYSNQQEITVYYSYSSVGMIHPRVRAVTADGQIFSGDDTLIIHDKIIKADIKPIDEPKSISILEVTDPNQPNVDGYEYVYILHRASTGFLIKRYMIEANNAVLLDNNSLYINLSNFGIYFPRQIKVDKNEDIYLSALAGKGSRIYRFKKGLSGYVLDNTFNINFTDKIIASFDISATQLYLSVVSDSQIYKYSKDGVLQENKAPVTNGIISETGEEAGIAVTNDRLWLADYRKQRVVGLSPADLSLRDFFGEAGSNEGQFISPAIVRVLGNYIYVMDKSEYTLQVFERVQNDYRIVCRIDNTTDCLPAGFLTYVNDFDVFTKLEDSRVYQYIALINSASGQTALLRIPQWQPNSIRVKSNLIVYTRNNEIFTSKPDGADARKIFASGALPGVDGKVDFPSIAPDGTTIVFVSRIEQYEYTDPAVGLVLKKYDKLYLIDVSGENCTLISDPAINGKEIDRPQFSYNGSQIIFSAKGSGEYWTIYSYDINSHKVTKLFTPTADCMRPTFSPDDRYIAYVTRFYNHNEIMIYDTERPDLVISLTNNDYADDYPVWSPVYPNEVDNNSTGITSKIAFISKPDFHEKIFYTYISQVRSGDFRIVKKDGTNIGGQPDNARNELPLKYDELGTISYPCFTSDGTTLIFEQYQDGTSRLMQYNFQTKLLTPTGVPEGARRPSGMKNRIVNFMAKVVNGNCINLTWNRYAEEDLLYTVEYLSSASNAQPVEISFKSQDHALIEDLDMGLTYNVRVFVRDQLRDEIITTSIWKKVVVPPVVAKPNVYIDADNPYLLHMEAWKPETDNPAQYQWKFRWFIDNYPQEETYSTISTYEFASAGVKRIRLLASNASDAAKNDTSADILVNIKGDLIPVINYDLKSLNGTLTLELDASHSTGRKLDTENFRWRITGSNVNGNQPVEEYTGAKKILNLSSYQGNLYVTLVAYSKSVMGQIETKPEEKSTTILIPLGLQEIKPAITETKGDDPFVYTFDGSSSIGNIDWNYSSWEIFGPDNVNYQVQGKSNFTYRFPAKNQNTNYTIILNARNKATGVNSSFTKIITIGSAPIVPVVDFKVLTASADGELVNARLLLSATSSRGTDIDWNSIRWNVPIADSYGSNAAQVGPTAVYNLYNIKKDLALDVHVTVQRRNSSDIVEATEVVVIKSDAVPEIVPYITVEKDATGDLYTSQEGDVYIFSALDSKGPNIDWNNVTWLLDGQYPKQGAVVRYDLKASGEDKQNIVVTLTLRSTGGGTPITKTLNYDVESKSIKIVVSNTVNKSVVNAEEHNLVHLSVRDSIGQNIDWERTKWSIYQGPESIIEKYGAEVVHAFPYAVNKEYYPVNVQMFFKGSSRPFIKDFNVRVEGDVFQAVIREEYDPERLTDNQYVRTFSAADSEGQNIDWQNAKWTFGDSSEYQYGPVVTHRFPFDRKDANYLVTLTLSRRTRDGKAELSTDTYTMSVGQDKLVANVTVHQNGDYVVFSAEKSEGRGVMLDRSLWYFEGADNVNSGDSSSYGTSDSDSSQTTINSNWNVGANISYENGFEGGIFGGVSSRLTLGASFGYQWGFNTSNSDSTSTNEQISQNSGEGSNNIYSGATCRKMITGWRTKRVTLIVYRALPDGTIEAQSKSFLYTVGQQEVNILN